MNLGLNNVDNTSDLDKPISTATQTALTGKTDVSLFNTHTGDTTIHYTKNSINLSDLGSSAHTHTISEISDFGAYLPLSGGTVTGLTFFENSVTIVGNDKTLQTANSSAATTSMLGANFAGHGFFDLMNSGGTPTIKMFGETGNIDFKTSGSRITYGGNVETFIGESVNVMQIGGKDDIREYINNSAKTNLDVNSYSPYTGVILDLGTTADTWNNIHVDNLKLSGTTSEVINGDGSKSTKDSLKPTLTKTMTILSATTSDNFTLFRAEVNLTIQEVNAVVYGGTSPSCNVAVFKHANRNNAGTAVVTSVAVTNETTGAELTVITVGSANQVAAGEWVWITTPTVTSTPDSITIDVRYTED